MACIKLESPPNRTVTAALRPWCRVLSGGRAIGLLWLLGALVIVGLEWFQPYYFMWDDNVLAYLPWRIFNYQCLVSAGEVPWINFRQYLGHEHLLAGSTGVLYWPAYAATFLADRVLGNIRLAVEVEMILLLLAGLAAHYAYFRIIKIPTVWSVYGSLLALTLPFWLSVSKSSLSFGRCFFFYPLCLACLEAYLRSGAKRYLFVSVLVKALCIYEGNMNFICIYLLGEAFYMVHHCRGYRSFGRARRDLAWYALSNGVAVTLALPLVVPMWVALQESVQRAQSMPLSASLQLSVHPWQWLQAQCFQFHERILFGTGTSLYYLGGCLVLPVIVMVLRRRGWLAAHKQVGLGLIWLTLLTFLLCTPANVILHGLPVYDRLRWPFKWYVWCAFGYSTLFTLAVYHLSCSRRIARGWLQALCLLAIGSNLTVALLPMTQNTFTEYRLDPVMAQIPVTPLVGGRCQAYRITSYRTTSPVDLRAFNFATMLGDHAFAGYDPLITRRLQEAVGGLNYDAVYKEVLTPSDRERFNQWSVRYFLTSNRPELINELRALGGMSFTGTTATGLALIENNQARPYASMVDHPTQALPVRFGVNQVEIQTGGREGALILTLLRCPGWYVRYDNGAYQPVVDATELGQMRLHPPAQAKTVTVRYWPPRMREMLWTSLAVLTVLAAACLLWRWHEGHKPMKSG